MTWSVSFRSMMVAIWRAARAALCLIPCVMLGCNEPRGTVENEDGGSTPEEAGIAIGADGGRPVGVDAGTHDLPDSSADRDGQADATDADSAVAPLDMDAGGLEPAFDAGWVSESDAGPARDDAGIPSADAGIRVPTTDAGPAPETWTAPPPNGLVASRGELGRHLSIAVDRHGLVTIGYSDDSNGWLVLAHGNASGFRTETFDAAAGRVSMVSVVRDRADRLHVGYSSEASGAIKHAVRDDAGHWSFASVRSRFSDSHRGGSMAVDSAGHPHFAYAAREPPYRSDGLVYSDFDGDVWQSESVDRASEFTIGQGADLELDPNDDAPHISYLDYTANRWRYARWTGAAWRSEAIADAAGFAMPLAITSRGEPALAYAKYQTMDGIPRGRIVLARPAVTGWTTELVFDGDSRAKALTFDRVDRPHVVYSVGTLETELHYARMRGRAWEDISLDSSLVDRTFNGPAALAIDARGNAHIAYQDALDFNVKYAFVAARPEGEDPCLGVVCPEHGEVTVCVSDSVARTTPSAGRCVAGLCEYTPVDTACPGGCYADQCARGTWSAISSSAPKTFYPGQAAAWTGTEMYLWGRTDGAQQSVRFNPLTGAWVANPVRTGGLDSGAGAWTGTGLTLWGGAAHAGGRAPLASGFTVDTADTLLERLPASPLSARSGHSVVWTGSELIVWGGIDALSNVLGDGAAYSPSTRTWRPLSTVDAPGRRTNHTAVWTGREMIVFGGCRSRCADSLGTAWLTSTGSRYDPALDRWTAFLVPDFLPAWEAERDQHSAVWTGTEMIVWGGRQNFTPDSEASVADGFAYDPATNTTRVISVRGAPTARRGHSAVWTGTEMIIWGGQFTRSGPPLNNGMRFRP